MERVWRGSEMLRKPVLSGFGRANRSEYVCALCLVVACSYFGIIRVSKTILLYRQFLRYLDANLSATQIV